MEWWHAATIEGAAIAVLGAVVLWMAWHLRRLRAYVYQRERPWLRAERSVEAPSWRGGEIVARGTMPITVEDLPPFKGGRVEVVEER